MQYPLGRPAKFAIRPDDTKVGFRRLELAQSICECYRRIYEVRHIVSLWRIAR